MLTSYELLIFFFFFSSRRRHTRLQGDWSSDVCSSDLRRAARGAAGPGGNDGDQLHAAAPGAVVAGFSPGAMADAGAGCGFATAAAGMGTLSAGCMTRRCSAGVGWQKQFG